MRLPTITTLALAGALALAAAPAPTASLLVEDGESSTVTYEEDATTFNLRRDNCGGEEANRLYLSVTSGEDTGDGCGTLGGVAPLLNEATITAEDAAIFENQYAAVDGLPVTIDAERDVTGQLTFGQYRGAAANPASLGGGNMVVDLTLTGSTKGFAFQVETTAEALALPGAGRYTVDFIFDLPANAQEKQITSLTLKVVPRGVSVGQDYLHTSDGVSNFVFPTLVEVPAAE